MVSNNLTSVVISHVPHQEFDLIKMPRYRVVSSILGVEHSVEEFFAQQTWNGLALLRKQMDENNSRNPQVFHIGQNGGQYDFDLCLYQLFKYGAVVKALAIQDDFLESGLSVFPIINNSPPNLHGALSELWSEDYNLHKNLPHLSKLNRRSHDIEEPNNREYLQRYFGRKAALYVVNGFPAHEENFEWAKRFHPHAQLDRIVSKSPELISK
ncbi:MAG: hypothetical protein AABW82_03725 [Nanoarchaeota archaeon]